MMKLLKRLVLMAAISIVTISSTWAQHKFPKVLYEKDSCYVYPYRINSYYNYEYSGSSTTDFMPCTDSLPDGKFIVYGEYTNYKQKGFLFFKKYTVSLDTTKVALIFSVHNGKRNGPCYWYNEEKKLERSGFYLNDEADGIWISFSDDDISDIRTYKNGLLSGPYIDYGYEGKIYKYGNYMNGRPVGEWKTYYYNGNIDMIYTLYPDSMGTPPLGYIQTDEDPLNYYSDEYKLSDLNGKVYTYYENGNIQNIGDYIFGYEKIDDTTYSYDGSIQSIRKLEGYTQDTLPTYTVTYYDNHDSSCSITYYKNGNDYLEKYYLRGHLLFEQYKFNWYDSTVPGKLYPEMITYDSTGKILSEEYHYRNPEAVSDVYLSRDIRHGNFSYDFSFNHNEVTGQLKAIQHSFNSDSSFHSITYYSGNINNGLEEDSTLIYYKNKLFNGDYIYKYRKSKKDDFIKVSNGKIIEKEFHDYSTSKSTRKYRSYIVNSKTNYVNGKENGNYLAKTFGGKTLIKSSYKDGKLDGEYLSYQKCKKGKKKYWGLKYQETYKNGFLEGPAYIYNRAGGYSSVKNYIKGMKNGECLNYSTDYVTQLDYLSSRANYVNDTLDGKYELYYSTGQVSRSNVYVMGKIDGRKITYNLDGSLSGIQNYNMGLLSGESYNYFLNPANTVKIICKYDEKDSVNSWGYYEDIPRRECLFTSFYKDGVKKVSEGRYGDYVTKEGTWKYWDDNGTLIKQSEYKDGKLLNPLSEKKNDSILYIGRITEWYSNGKIKLEGYILDESSEYDCRVEQDVAKEEIYYTNFWLSDGTQLINDKNGKLQSYYADGKMETQAIIKEGLKDGLYKAWDPDGHLETIGNYKNGLMEGRWLSGDLEGVNYVDDQCFSSEEDLQNALRASKENVSITIMYYLKGELVKSSTFYKNAGYYNYDWIY